TNGTPGSTSYSYQIFNYDSNGDGIPATAVTIATGPTTLTSVNSITITLPASVAGQTGFGIMRTVGGGSTGLLQRVADNAISYTDTGLAATAYVASIAQPATPAGDFFNIGGQ